MDNGYVMYMNFKFFHSMPQLISRGCVKWLFEVKKTEKYFLFVLPNLFNNVSQRDTMIHYRMLWPKTRLYSCPLFFYFYPLNNFKLRRFKNYTWAISNLKSQHAKKYLMFTWQISKMAWHNDKCMNQNGKVRTKYLLSCM